MKKSIIGCGVLAILMGMQQGGEAHAASLQYQFVGQISSVIDPLGGLAAAGISSNSTMTLQLTYDDSSPATAFPAGPYDMIRNSQGYESSYYGKTLLNAFFDNGVVVYGGSGNSYAIVTNDRHADEWLGVDGPPETWTPILAWSEEDSFVVHSTVSSTSSPALNSLLNGNQGGMGLFILNSEPAGFPPQKTTLLAGTALPSELNWSAVDEAFFSLDVFDPQTYTPTGRVVVDLSGATPTKTSPVPVPGAVWLLGSGLSSLVAYRKRRTFAER